MMRITLVGLVTMTCLLSSVACRKSGSVSQFPSRAEVEKSVRVGMSRSDVIMKFGSPLQEFSDDDGFVRMIYMSPSFYSPGQQPLHYVGFQIILKDDRVVKWMPTEGRSY